MPGIWEWQGEEMSEERVVGKSESYFKKGKWGKLGVKIAGLTKAGRRANELAGGEKRGFLFLCVVIGLHLFYLYIFLAWIACVGCYCLQKRKRQFLLILSPPPPCTYSSRYSGNPLIHESASPRSVLECSRRRKGRKLPCIQCSFTCTAQDPSF